MVVNECRRGQALRFTFPPLRLHATPRLRLPKFIAMLSESFSKKKSLGDQR